LHLKLSLLCRLIHDGYITILGNPFVGWYTTLVELWRNVLPNYFSFKFKNLNPKQYS
jgi:hypothetical protein